MAMVIDSRRRPIIWFIAVVLSSLLSCNGFSSHFPVRKISNIGGYSSSSLSMMSSTSYLDSITATTGPTQCDDSTSATTNESITNMRNSDSTSRPRAEYDSMICGGGPAGLLSAIMLARKYPDDRVAVVEQRAAIPPSPFDDTIWNDVARFYLLGIGWRGQNALKKFGVFDDFVAASVAVNGRRNWEPGMTKVEEGTITPANKAVVSRVLPRDKLVGLLHRHIVENYGDTVDLLYGYELEPTDFGDSDNKDDLVTVRISKCSEEAADDTIKYVASQESDPLCDVDSFVQISRTKLLIAADGSARTVANAMEKYDAERIQNTNKFIRPFVTLNRPKPFKVTRFVDDNPRVYKSVPIRLPSDWPCDLNYSSRQSRVNLEALPSDDKGSLCALLLMKPEEELAQEHADVDALRNYFNQELPQFGALIDDEEMAKLADKPASQLPAFRFSGPRLHCGHRTLVLGDAAHTVKPYYGLGANSALEDVSMLSDALDDTNDVVTEAVLTFSNRRSADSAALVTMSRNMDRPGKLFLTNFLLPLILDGIFHKLAPRVFDPNMFAMFQRQGITFRQIQKKKRLDRALQALCLGGALVGSGAGVKAAVGLLARVTGRSPALISGMAVTSSFAVAILLRQKKKVKAEA